MELLFIIAVVVLLYYRSLDYFWMPDDAVKRGQYLYDVPEQLPPLDFIKTKPRKIVRVWCIANHCLNVAFIYVLFGWKAAFLFAIHPVAVNEVCWVTGNYYAGTTLLVLAAYWCIQSFGWIGTLPALAFYTAALNSTITALGFPLFYLMTLNPAGCVMFAPFVRYFTGDRFKKGIALRKDMRQKDFDRIELKKVAFMTKVVGEYVSMFFLPLKMALYRKFGENVTRAKIFYDKDCRFNEHFYWSALKISMLILVGFYVNWQATLWFFCMIAPHSQFKVYGQSNPCNRYLYLPMIGLCILGAAMPSWAYWMFAGFLIYKTHLYIPAWRNQESLHKWTVTEVPNRAVSHSDYAQHVLTARVQVNDKDKDINMINLGLYHMNTALRMNEANKPYDIFEVYLNMAYTMSLVGNIPEATSLTDRALELGKEQGISDLLRNRLEEQHLNFNKFLEKNNASMVNNSHNAVPVPENAAL